MIRVFSCSLMAVTMFCVAGVSTEASTYSFQTINNPGDPNFNQLLGINNEGTIAGYFGDGMGTVPNNGYTWTKTGGFVVENFKPSAQTQVVAINNTVTNGSYNTVGFFVDATGANHGFAQAGGVQNAVDNPLTKSSPAFNQLLGVNDHNVAVGVYEDAANNMHGYQIDLTAHTVVGIALPSSFNATSVMAAGINNNGWVAGNYTAAGVTHGFLDENGTFLSLDDPKGNGTNTSFFGLNNNGEVVGSFVDANGTNGLVYNLLTNSWQTVDDPNQSFTAAFTFTGTTLNGINDLGQVVGFYSDGRNVNGVLATATAAPEPTASGLMLLAGGLLALGGSLRRKRSV